jgi:ribonuclease R
MSELRSSNPEWREAQKEAHDFVMPDDWQSGREIVDGITIDEAHSNDRDDAIWLLPNDQGGHNVTTSIADVGSFLSPDSKVAQHAQSLGETRYFRSRYHPMLPRILGEKALSLLETHAAPALTVDLTLDDGLRTVDMSISRRSIRPMRATYDEVADYTHRSDDDPRVDIYKTYENFALKLLKSRQGKGAFAFYNPEQGMMTDEEGRLVQFEAGVEHSGQVIVQEFMILTNAAVGLYMQRNTIPGLFRQHRLAQPIDIQEAVSLIESGQKHHLDVIRQGMGRAWFTADPGVHEALQLPVYAPYTSPLRRYADLVNHWNILAHLDGRDYPFSSDELDETAAHLNDVQTEIRTPSIYFKQKDVEVSTSRLRQDAASLLELAPGDYRRVVKVAMRSGEAPAGFQESLANKIENNTLLPEDMAVLLCNEQSNDTWRTIKSNLMAHIAQKPERATNALNVAQDQELVDLVTATSEQATAGFVWKVAIDMNGASFEGRGKHRQNDGARHIAAARALADLSGVDIDIQEQPQDPATVGNKHPKSVLHEYAQHQNLSLPQFTVKKIWTDGTENLFQATAIINGTTYVGHDRTKKGAEAAAATEAIKALSLDASVVDKKEVVNSNPISALYERSAKRQISPPTYTFDQYGTPNNSTFSCTVTVLCDDGELRPFSATGSTKNAAKTSAAALAVDSVRSQDSRYPIID